MKACTNSPAHNSQAFPSGARYRRLQCRATPDKLSYKDAGVDIDAGNELINRIKKLNPDIGGFNGMFPFGALRNGPCLHDHSGVIWSGA